MHSILGFMGNRRQRKENEAAARTQRVRDAQNSYHDAMYDEHQSLRFGSDSSGGYGSLASHQDADTYGRKNPGTNKMPFRKDKRKQKIERSNYDVVHGDRAYGRPDYGINQ